MYHFEITQENFIAYILTNTVQKKNFTSRCIDGSFVRFMNSAKCSRFYMKMYIVFIEVKSVKLLEREMQIAF